MLNTTSGDVELIEVPTRNAEPFGIVVDPDNRPWASASGSNKLFEIDSSTFSLREIELPDADSRPRRLVATSDGDIWFADYSRGRLGHYAVLNGQITQWLMPGGEDSKPYGMAVDRDDRIWIVETGNVPNRFVGFDTGSGVFLNETDIPSGGGTVSHMYYHEPAGEVWFATATNYIGRAKVH
jgi:virginiamycin B lyase